MVLLLKCCPSLRATRVFERHCLYKLQLHPTVSVQAHKSCRMQLQSAYIATMHCYHESQKHLEFFENGYGSLHCALACLYTPEPDLFLSRAVSLSCCFCVFS